MGKYFGTDGVRGSANETLTLDMAVSIGTYLGWYYGKNHRAKILIGKDTRLSGDMFEMGVAAGATAAGANVYMLGVCPTPTVSYLCERERFDCGVMISASHNPYHDNGIKLFNGNGCKMDDEVLNNIEKYIDRVHSEDVCFATDNRIGKTIYWDEGLELYRSHLKSLFNIDLSGLSIMLDLANGSAISTAYDTLSSLGAEVHVIHGNANGTNINLKCGSTHTDDLQRRMKEGNYDVGFAFDGDADRLIVVDEDGNIMNGDYFMYIIGCYMKAKNQLKDNVVVTTVMSNLGLYRAFDKVGINTKITNVGDKYVFECLKEHDYVLGGEQSGHIIFYQHQNTGDGLFSALKLLEVMKESGKSLKQLGAELFIYPQLLVNTPIKDKSTIMQNQDLLERIKEVETVLGQDGRILVRPSGTEPLLRVMVEAKTDELCHQYVYAIIDFIKEKGL